MMQEVRQLSPEQNTSNSAELNSSLFRLPTRREFLPQLISMALLPASYVLAKKIEEQTNYLEERNLATAQRPIFRESFITEDIRGLFDLFKQRAIRGVLIGDGHHYSAAVSKFSNQLAANEAHDFDFKDFFIEAPQPTKENPKFVKALKERDQQYPTANEIRQLDYSAGVTSIFKGVKRIPCDTSIDPDIDYATGLIESSIWCHLAPKEYFDGFMRSLHNRNRNMAGVIAERNGKRKLEADYRFGLGVGASHLDPCDPFSVQSILNGQFQIKCATIILIPVRDPELHQRIYGTGNFDAHYVVTLFDETYGWDPVIVDGDKGVFNLDYGPVGIMLFSGGPKIKTAAQKFS